MPAKAMLLSLLVATLLQMASLNHAAAQYVNSTAFCISIHKTKCVRALIDGAQFSMTDLRKIGGKPTIYFYASVNAPTRMPLVLNMVRQGSCYPANVTASPEKVAQNPGMFSSIWSYVKSGRAVDDFLRIFDITHVTGEVGAAAGEGVGKIDAKLNPVVVPNSNNFGIWDYRNVLCPGSIKAIVMDSDGNVIPGDNAVKTLIVQ
jgi:hypothetical protein